MSGIFVLVILVDDTVYINHDKVTDTHIQEERANCDACRARTVYNNGNILHLLACTAYSIDKCRAYYNCSSMLIIVKYRNIELFFQSAFNLKASRC